jgi:hypothetical protein
MNRSSENLFERWQALSSNYLPVSMGDEWRYSRGPLPGDPDQGWKLHVSATILTANDILEKIAPELKKKDILYKAPVSLAELGKLNSGMFYGYSQIGKFITVYPREGEDVVSLAETLHRLTEGIPAPAIPFDTRYLPGSNVYYRYGAFNLHEIEDEAGKKIAVIRDGDGKFVPDDRDRCGPPDWVTDPFPASPAAELPDGKNPLQTTYKAFRALSQRGKGGVFNAIDMSMDTPRLCVLKEGRRNGEVDWEGLDGFDYVKREAANLNALRSAVPDLPAVYSTFEVEGNYYLVTEHIDGETLNDVMMKRRRRLSVKKALELSIEISLLMKRIHAAGWAWHDCKPANLLITKTGRIRPIDFEGARSFDSPKSIVWGTTEFLPPEWRERVSGEAITSSDLFAMGAVIYCLLSGRYYDHEKPVPLEKHRKGLPKNVRDLVEALLGPEPEKRPSIDKVIEILSADLLGLAVEKPGL